MQPGHEPAPANLSPPPGHPRFELLDAFRGAGCLMVLTVHTALQSGQLSGAGGLWAHFDIALAIFFALSGFVMYRPFVAARELGAPGQRMGDYARKRFLRIYPAYWVALTLLAIYPGLHGVFTGDWWVYYGILQNFDPLYDPSGGCQREVLECGISASWSIGIEVVFYALLPLYALGIAVLARRARRRWLLAELAVLALFFAASLYYQYERFGPDGWLNGTPLPLMWWLGMGMALAAVSVAVEQSGSRRLPAMVERFSGMIWAAAAAIFAVLVFVVLEPLPVTLIGTEGRDQYMTLFFFYGLIALLLLVPPIFAEGVRRVPQRILANRVLAWLGAISLGVYLWHVPLMIWLVDHDALEWTGAPFPTLTAATIAVSVFFGALSYYLVERPLLRRKNRRIGLLRLLKPTAQPR